MRPNIVLIYMDDMGWRDIGCAGSTFYETPHIDALCAQGMRFDRAYAACPVCSPSRASLLSGQYPARVGITDWIDHAGWVHPLKGRLIDATYKTHLPEDCVTVAEALRRAGYHTWHVGKWHLGAKEYYPQRFGFETNIGGCWWGLPCGGYFSPYGIETLPDGPDGEYLTDRLTDEAIRLIERQRDNAPFFLNLWHYAVHIPMQAKPQDIRRFQEKRIRLGLDKQTEIVRGERHPTFTHQDKFVERRMLQSDPTYAAMIWNLDENVGRLVRALKETGKYENTVIVFTSDNGGLSTAEGSPTCNLPAREGKGWMYEGGTRVPMFVTWPGQIAAGSVTQTPVTTPDLYPTLLETAGLPDADPHQPCDGVSLLPVLRGGSLPRRPLFWHYPHYGNQGGTPGASVLYGRYKLIHFFETERDELYDIENDLSETRNLAAQNPEKAAQLRALLEDWLLEVDAKRPEINPDFTGFVD